MAQVSAVLPAVRIYNMEVEDDVDDDLAPEESEEEDDGLIAAMEALDFADGYQESVYVENDE